MCVDVKRWERVLRELESQAPRRTPAMPALRRLRQDESEVQCEAGCTAQSALVSERKETEAA